MLLGAWGARSYKFSRMRTQLLLCHFKHYLNIESCTVSGTQNDGVATVGTDQSSDDCVKNCKLKKLAKQGSASKPHVHHVKSMHKGAPSHNTPHNKGPRNRKNMPGQDLPQTPPQGNV